MRSALKIWRAQKRLQSRFPDLSVRSIMFALDRGRRSLGEAKHLLKLATNYMQLDQLVSLVEALERADWHMRSTKHSFSKLHAALLQQVRVRLCVCLCMCACMCLDVYVYVDVCARAWWVWLWC